MNPSNLSSAVIQRAGKTWFAGRPLEAGKDIFEHLKFETRPVWAKTILEAAVSRTNTQIPAIRFILSLADEPRRWHEAHAGFSAIRKLTLRLEDLQTRSPNQELDLAMLHLAENVAKVVYNGTNPPDSFDEDAGWWIAVCVNRVLELLADRDFADRMWKILCGRGLDS